MTGLHLIKLTEDSLSLCFIEIVINKPLHVKYQRDQCLTHFSFFSKQNDLPKCSKYLGTSSFC